MRINEFLSHSNFILNHNDAIFGLYFIPNSNTLIAISEKVSFIDVKTETTLKVIENAELGGAP